MVRACCKRFLNKCKSKPKATQINYSQQSVENCNSAIKPAKENLYSKDFNKYHNY